jgi:hypothetical protein
MFTGTVQHPVMQLFELGTLRLQPGCHLPNSPCAGIIQLFPPRESLVSDIPAGDGNVANFL